MRDESLAKERTLGIYIHIPFCVRKCLYCDFLSEPVKEGRMERYIKALTAEICMTGPAYADYTVDTVFFGGGTPSLLPEGAAAALLNALRGAFCLDGAAEITLEANPGTVDAGRLAEYKKAGVNRLSLGLQSADEKELSMLGRIHSYGQFLDSFRLAEEAGFDNINVDIMSGLPGQREETFHKTLADVVSLKPAHLSVYGLMLEEGTPLYDRYKDQEQDEEADRRMYEETGRFLAQHGYERYEISNYARPGRQCRHNLKYWQRAPYLGLGLGASSMVENMRFRNISDCGSYERLLLEEGRPEAVREETVALQVSEQMEEFMFLGLRLMDGVSDAAFYETFGRSLQELYAPVLARLMKDGLLCSRADACGVRYVLTERGIDVSNYVMAQFLF